MIASAGTMLVALTRPGAAGVASENSGPFLLHLLHLQGQRVVVGQLLRRALRARRLAGP
jgi:hypothetical protein